MIENEIDMAMSEEDLVMIVVGLLVFVLSFSDIGTSAPIGFAAFPSILVFLVGWVAVRFRRRPLPKQIHQTRSIYLAHIKSLRNYNLISIILFDILLLSRYIQAEDAIRTVVVINFIALFVLSLIEFAGHITVSDSLEVIPRIEGESEDEYKRNRFALLYGSKYWIWLGITSIIALVPLGFIFAQVFFVRDVLIIILQFLSLLGGVGIFLFFHYRTLRFEAMDDPVMVVKAAEYYEESDLKNTSVQVLEEYLKEDKNNVAILSKLAVLYVQMNKHGKVLDYTKRILAETEEKSVNVPHLISKAHLLRAISLKAKEDYQEAYKEVAASLRYTPESAAARKLRRDLRKILKIKQQENKE